MDSKIISSHLYFKRHVYIYINIAAYLCIESLWKNKEETSKCWEEDVLGLEIMMVAQTYSFPLKHMTLF